MKPARRKQIRTDRRNGDGYAVRTYPEIAFEMMYRHGIRVSPERVQQLCSGAERKIAKLLGER